MVHSVSFVDGSSDSVEWREVQLGVRRLVLGYGNELLVARVVFEAGVSAGAHSHADHDQSSYVASGVFEVRVGSAARILRSGDGFFVDRGVVHDTLCIEAGELVDTFSPCRLDMI